MQQAWVLGDDVPGMERLQLAFVAGEQMRELEQLENSIPAAKLSEALDKLTEQDIDNETVRSFRAKLSRAFM